MGAAGNVYIADRNNGHTEAHTWLDGLVHSLRHGKEGRVVRKLQELLENPPARPPQTQETLEREVNYFASHRDHLHYQEMEKAGAPLGSGAVESLGKQLQGRLRGCGQVWARSRFTHLLRVSVLVKNKDDPLLWN